MPILLIILTILIVPVDLLARGIPSRPLPPSATVSEATAALADAPLNPVWLKRPADMEEMRKIIRDIAAINEEKVREAQKNLQVTVKKHVINNVPVFIVQPKELPVANRDRALLHFHGGAYILNPGEAGLMEALLMAEQAKIPVISVDYRMAPDHPFPAALDDVVAVYQGMLQKYAPHSLGVFGTSTGVGLVLALLLKAREMYLPFPAAIAAGTPWSDLGKTGDSYFANEGVDNVLVTYDGLLGEAARAYANGHDMKDPLLSPVYGDVSGFPPVLLVSGTRDLFLSNTVNMHKKFLEKDIPTELVVMEGISHAQYLEPDIPENKFYFQLLEKFFNRHLEKGSN